MKKMILFILTIISFDNLFPQDCQTSEKDTVYYFSPVVVYPLQAKERETPATFSNLNIQQITERYSVQDIPVLLSELPSITSYSENGNGIGYNYINLRGFDQRRLSIMINGIPQNDPEDHNVYWIDFPDLLASTELIQVQRGAGSAFYGPPAIGGSINLITNPFRKKPGFTIESVLGFQEFGDSANSFSLNTKKISVSINSGLVDDKYMFYGKLGKIISSGYRQNSWVEMNSYFLGVVRFDKNVTTRIHLFGGPFSDGLSYFGLPKFVGRDTKLRRQNLSEGWSVDSTGKAYAYATPRRKQEIENFSQPHYELIQQWRLSPKLMLNNTLFYYNGEGFYDYDASWADTSMLRLGSNYGIPVIQNPINTLVRAFVSNRQYGWLPHVEFDHSNGTLTLGAELRLHRSTHWGKIQYAEDLPHNYDPDHHFYEYKGKKDMFSLFVHELFKLQEDVAIMGDLQLVKIRYGIDAEKYSENNFNIDYFFANPRFGINYNINEEWNSYFSIGYTSREPRLKNLYAAEYSSFGDTPQFMAETSNGKIYYDYSKPYSKPEHLLNIEIGLGYDHPNAHFSTNLYWMEFMDELVKSGQVDIFGQPVTGNAARTRHIGYELDGAVTLLKNLNLSGNVTISDNRLIDYKVYQVLKDSAGNNYLSIQNLSHNPISGFPDLLGNVRITFNNDFLTLSLVTKYVGAFYTDNNKNEENKNDAYTIFNGEILYRFPKILGSDFKLRAEVRNILNRLYFTNGEGEAFFPAAERNYIVGITIGL
jgi:iron complex outermembrane recepter protein